MKFSALETLLFSLFLPLIAAHAQQQPQSAQPSLSLTISVPGTAVKAGSPLKLKITTTNTSDHDVSYLVSTDGLYDVYVHDAAGALAPETPEGARKHFWSPNHRPEVGSVFVARYHLEARARQEIEVDITKEYHLTKPGKYTVYVERPDPENKGKQIKSNTITITVMP
jgi:hypothetical protein